MRPRPRPPSTTAHIPRPPCPAIFPPAVVRLGLAFPALSHSKTDARRHAVQPYRIPHSAPICYPYQGPHGGGLPQLGGCHVRVSGVRSLDLAKRHAIHLCRQFRHGTAPRARVRCALWVLHGRCTYKFHRSGLDSISHRIAANSPPRSIRWVRRKLHGPPRGIERWRR